ncbi:MAG: hypothetical protein QNI84_14050 [Henriciella sp.]|nr:hypothetical protein [Henriciella sp.]
MNAANDNEPMNPDALSPSTLTRAQFCTIQSILGLSNSELARELNLSEKNGGKRVTEYRRGTRRITQNLAADMIGLLREARDEREAG